MSSEERVYTINLGKALLSQSQHRAVRAINMIREFASKHMRSGDVKIDEDLAHQIWARGVRNPPRRIRVKMWTGDSGEIIVSRYDEAETTDAKPAPEPEMPAVSELASEADDADVKTADLEPAKNDSANLDDQPAAEKPAEPEPVSEGSIEPEKDQPAAEKPAEPEPVAEPAEPASKDRSVTKEPTEQEKTQDKN